MEVGDEGEYIPIATLSPQNDSCIKVGNAESHFNVHNLSIEKGEPTRYRTEVLPLTSLTPYR